jgi:hypothetical protein
VQKQQTAARRAGAGGRDAGGSEQRFGTKRGGRAAAGVAHGVANRDMRMGGARWTEAGSRGERAGTDRESGQLVSDSSLPGGWGGGRWGRIV